MPCLSLFLTNNASLSNWRTIGTLDRELAVYRKLAAEGWKVSLYTYDRRRSAGTLGAGIDVHPQWPFLIPNVLYLALMGVLRYGSGRKTDVVMTNQAHGGWPAVLAGRLWGAKVLARSGMVHGECSQVLGKNNRRARMKARAERWTFRHCDRAVVPTRELADWIRRHYRIAPEKINVVPNYVDTSLFRPLPGVEKDFDVVSVGRLVPKKRFALLLAALAGSGLKVRIIGAGKEEGRLREFAASNRIDLTVTQRLVHAALPAELNRAKIYADVASWEGHPKALIEAMACGCACVGADSPGIKNLITDMHTGLAVDSEPGHIRSAVERLLSDRSLREALGSRARKHAEHFFSLDKVFLQYKHILEELIE